MIEQILVVIDDEGEAVALHAAQLAAGRRAQAEALLLAPTPSADIVAPGGMPILLFDERAFQSIVAYAEDRARAIAARAAGLTVRAVAADALVLPGDVAAAARTAGLVVTAPPRGWSTAWLGRAAIEAVLFDSGRPLLLLAQAPPPRFSRAMVAWNDTREAARALHDALPLLEAGAAIDIVAFASADDVAPALVDVLRRRGFDARAARGERGPARIGDAFQREARERGADLLVMGAYGHSRAREWLLGGGTREVIEAPTLPVLLSH